MGNNYDKWSSNGMDKGIDNFGPDVTADLSLDIETFNLSSGIHQGIGPRYGMAPLAGHADAETPSGARVNGYRKSEDATGTGFKTRNRLFGISTLRLGSYADITAKGTFYFAVMGRSSSSGFDIVAHSSYQNIGGLFPDLYKHSADLRDGLSSSSLGSTDPNFGLMTDLINVDFSTRPVALAAYLGALDTTLNYVSTTSISVSGRDVPSQWLLGEALTTGDATHAPCPNFTRLETIAAYPFILCGITPEFNIKNYKKAKRSVYFYAIKDDGTFNIDYRVEFTPTNAIINSSFNLSKVEKNIDVSAIVATKLTAGTGYANTKAVVVNDDLMVCNSSYKAILAAAKKPYVAIVQEWARNTDGVLQQWVDITNLPINPKVKLSIYSEGGASISTVFSAWPIFVRGTPMVSATNGVSLGGPNTGILRANTVYEFNFSIFNKRLNFETNVGARGIKFQTGTDDFIGLQLFDAGAGSKTLYDAWANGTVATNSAPHFTGVGPDFWALNYLEYRFYYRAEGSYEWLPALFIDMVKFWFYTHNNKLTACAAPIAGLPGGQPGGFSDYSQLPDDQYTCVLIFKSRVFWFSDKAVVYAYANNIFAYAGRNSLAAVGGEFRGGIVHNYPGQAEQTSRLIIFSSKETYVARFTGAPLMQPIQVSSTTVAEFPVDGSDLAVDPWTNLTAFSYRSACIADGILYWWGSDGVVRDGGVDTPEKVSQALEPDLSTLYDPNDIANIFAHYNSRSREIFWYFKPKSDPVYQTYALILNTRTGLWLLAKFLAKIDSAQDLEIQGTASTFGKRTVISARFDASATIQRPFFFDYRNRSGDMRPTCDWVVKQISTPSAGQRRLTLAAGYDATNLATVAVGDYIALQQLGAYAPSMTLDDDFLGKVTAVGTGTIDITIPTGAQIDATIALSQPEYFPIWHAKKGVAGLNGITWQMKTWYWGPGGLNYFGIWMYLYLYIKLLLLKSVDEQTIQVSHRTQTSGDFVTETVPLVDNSDGNCQIYLPLLFGDTNNAGQAIRFKIAGVQIISEAVLQYLEAHSEMQDENALLQFQEE